MVARPPLTLIDGRPSVLPAGDTLEGVGGGGSGANALQVAVDFGASFTDRAYSVVTGLAWVGPSTVLVAQIITPAGTDPDEMTMLKIKAEISDIVAGVGLTLTLHTEHEARGPYTVNIIGI